MKRFSFFTPRLLAADGLALDVSGLGDVHAKGHPLFQHKRVLCADAGAEQLVLGFSDGTVSCMGNSDLRPVLYGGHDAVALFVRVVGHNLILTITPGEATLRRIPQMQYTRARGASDSTQQTSELAPNLVTIITKRLPRNNPLAFDCYVKGHTIMMAFGYQTGIVSIVALTIASTGNTTGGIASLASPTTTNTFVQSPTITSSLREVACLNDPAQQERKNVDDEPIVMLLFASPPPVPHASAQRGGGASTTAATEPSEVYVISLRSIKSWNFHTSAPVVLERSSSGSTSAINGATSAAPAPSTTTSLTNTNCCLAAPQQQQLIVAHSDRVALYSTDAPGSCYALSSVTPPVPQPPPQQDVSHVASINNQIIVVTSARQIQIYDFAHKFISFASNTLLAALATSGADVEFITHVLVPTSNVFGEPNSNHLHTRSSTMMLSAESFMSSHQVYIITNRNRIFILYEKSTPQKLQELMRRNLYSLASKLAIGQEPATVADIHKRHADHLYDKGSFQEAVEIYALIADRIEPSYVVRKFFDAPRVAQLVYFLEALHLPSSSTQHSSLSSFGNGGELLLPLSSSSEHVTSTTTKAATASSSRCPPPDLTVLLLNCYVRLPDAADKITALLHTSRTIDVDSALSVLRDTKYFPQALALAKERHRHAWFVEASLGGGTSPDHAAVIKYIADVVVDAKEVIKLLVVYGAAMCRVVPQDTCLLAIKALQTDPTIPPDALIDAFAEHPKELVAILEECTARSSVCSPRVWNTLLELYLTPPTNNAELALNLLSDPRSNYDRAVCSTLCRESGFRRGLLVLYERNSEWDLLIREYVAESDQEDRVLSLAKTHCPRDVDVWMFLLGSFAEKNSPFLKAALRHVEQLDVLPSLMVLRLLSRVAHLPLSAVKPYLSSQIERAARQSAADEAEIQQLEEDTQRMHQELIQLRTKPIEFRATTCALTGAPLELPTVHFLSMNSYNMSSLQATSFKLEDPKCVVQHRDVLDIARGLAKQRGEIDEEFFGELETSSKGEQSFGVVAAAFGKCLFDG